MKFKFVLLLEIKKILFYNKIKIFFSETKLYYILNHLLYTNVPKPID